MLQLNPNDENESAVIYSLKVKLCMDNKISLLILTMGNALQKIMLNNNNMHP